MDPGRRQKVLAAQRWLLQDRVSCQDPGFIEYRMLHCLAFIAEVTVDGMDHAVLRLDNTRVVKGPCRLLLQMPGYFPREAFVGRETDGKLISARGGVVVNQYPMSILQPHSIQP